MLVIETHDWCQTHLRKPKKKQKTEAKIIYLDDYRRNIA